MTDVPPHHDRLTRFLLDASGIRGVLVRLDATWAATCERVDYPTPVRDLLGQTMAAAALFGGHVKIDGRLGIQLRGAGALRTLFAEYASGGALRGIALWQEPLPAQLTPRDFGDNALLAITMEIPSPGHDEPHRHQGLVGLDADNLAQAFETYFAVSEQLPTRLLLACNAGSAVGLLLQPLPGAAQDGDGWPRAQALFETLTAEELLATDAHTLLYRLFHEDGVRILAEQPLSFQCRCSRERVGAMLLSLGRDEALAAIQPPDHVVEVDCEFCGQRYRFDAVDIGQLFAGGGSESATSLH
jgi:molecular chaperone Hsp33